MRGIRRWFKKWDCALDGHEFVGKYDKKFPEGSFKSRGMTADEIMEHTYICSVCKHCGEVAHER